MEKNANAINKVLDVADNVARIGANLSERKDAKAPAYPDENDNSNKAAVGGQNIQISMGSDKEPQPPVEKHIHEYPEGRALTTEECELSLKKAQMDYELNKSRQDYLIQRDKREYEHRLEVEKKNERKGTIRRIIGGILVAVGIGGVGYSIYADYRNNKTASTVPKALPEANNTPAGGAAE